MKRKLKESYLPENNMYLNFNFASKTNANIPAARGEAALVPPNLSVHSLCNPIEVILLFQSHPLLLNIDFLSYDFSYWVKKKKFTNM